MIQVQLKTATVWANDGGVNWGICDLQLTIWRTP
jgi:hypothetical protein